MTLKHLRPAAQGYPGAFHGGRAREDWPQASEWAHRLLAAVHKGHLAPTVRRGLRLSPEEILEIGSIFRNQQYVF